MSAEATGLPVVARQFLSFAIIGALGFLVDAGVLTLGLLMGLGFYAGRLVSYLAAATFTWYCNRRMTFREEQGRSRKAEWLRFILWNAAGGVVNLGLYSVLISQGGLFTRAPVLAVAAGSVAGLVLNFLVSKLFVFRR
jgi:putative flippase GtrA